MSLPIRSRKPNSPGCPQDTATCSHDTCHFDLMVENKMSGEPKPVYVMTWGLGDRTLIIGRVYGEDCDPLFSPFYCGGEQMCLSKEYPDTVLTMPGTYRFLASDGQPLNWDEDFAYEKAEVHVEYAQLWFQQQQLHCCRANIPHV